MEIERQFTARAAHYLRRDYLPKIRACLNGLSEEQIWWRPNEHSNSIGNLLLHLCGNVNQWAVATLGGREDVRRRNEEFENRGAVGGQALLEMLEATVEKAAAVIEGLDSAGLRAEHDVQIYRVTGLQAVFHVVEHFSYHTGQICYIAKQLGDRDLNFYPDL